VKSVISQVELMLYCLDTEGVLLSLCVLIDYY